jgi:hypothetical protein
MGTRDLGVHIMKDYRESEIDELPESFDELMSEIERAEEVLRKADQYC